LRPVSCRRPRITRRHEAGRNGFRIDQAFVNAALLARVKDAAYVWGGRRGACRDSLSDHAALLIDLADV
jgi:exonuclease III